MGEDPLDERGGLAPVVAHLVDQLRGVDDRLEAEVLAERHRLVPQQGDAGVVDAVAARCGLQLLAAELPACRRQAVDDRLEICAVSRRRRSPRGWRPAGPTTPRRSRRRPAHRPRRSGRSSPSTEPSRCTRPDGSCTASCPSRTGRRGTGGTPSPCRTRARATDQRLHRRGDGLVVRGAVGFPERLGVVHLQVVVEVERGLGEPGELGHGARIVSVAARRAGHPAKPRPRAGPRPGRRRGRSAAPTR